MLFPLVRRASAVWPVCCALVDPCALVICTPLSIKQPAFMIPGDVPYEICVGNRPGNVTVARGDGGDAGAVTRWRPGQPRARCSHQRRTWRCGAQGPPASENDRLAHR